MAQGNAQAASAYYDANTGVRVFRLALNAVERLWPALAVRAAARLFGTPLPPRWLQRRADWGSAWRSEPLPFEGASVTLYAPSAANADAPVVLLVHGWGGNARQLQALAEGLAQAGFHPVLVEMPAHGRSRGQVSNLPQFARAIEYVAARLGQRGLEVKHVVAHSMGANAAAYAAGRGLSIDRLVMVAPPASPREFTRLFASVFGLKESTRARMQQWFEEREAMLMAHFEPAASGPRVRAAATLVIHDRTDRVNRFEDGQAFAHAIPGARFIATEGHGHRKILKEPAVLDAIAAFLR
jgi:pimeloyl-ACP methyl ester carboxylesterase